MIVLLLNGAMTSTLRTPEPLVLYVAAAKSCVEASVQDQLLRKHSGCCHVGLRVLVNDPVDHAIGQEESVSKHTHLFSFIPLLTSPPC